MPRFNDRGALAVGLGRDWYDATRTIAQECNETKPGCRLSLSDGTVIREGGLVALHASDGVWAIMPFPEGGYLDSFGRRFPDSAPGPVSPDGAIAIKVTYHSFGPWDVIEPDGSRWRLTDGDATDIQLLGGRRAIWRERGILHTKGITVEQPAGEWGWPRMISVGSVYRLLYQSYSGGALVFDGRVIAEGVNFFRPDAIVIGDVLRVVWSTQPQEVGATPEPIEIPLARLASLPTVGTTKPNPGTPAPPPVPIPEPKPMEAKALPADVHAIVVALYLANKDLAHGNDDDRRKLQRKICETVRARKGKRWGWKSNHGIGIANAKDAIAELPEGATFTPNQRQPLYMWDLFNGGTREPHPAPIMSDTAHVEQFFVPVEPIDHLADVSDGHPKDEPKDDPSPTDPVLPDVLTTILARLNALEGDAIRSVGLWTALRHRVSELEQRVAALEQKPAPTYRVVGSTSRTFSHSHNINVTLEAVK